jgi:heavy metal sensor kinase
VNRLPIRLRLTVAFAAAMALVLSATGYLLYQHLGASLDRTLAQDLRARAADITALVTQADNGLGQAGPSPFSGASNGIAQVINAGGRIIDETPGLGPRVLLTPAQLLSARHAVLHVDQVGLGDREVRLLALPVVAQGQRLVVVVGAPLEVRDSALAGLRSELLVGGPAALLFASLIGYLVAAAALGPVERMRARAAAITAASLSERLPVARSRDELARLGETLNAMLERLEVALERERGFVADASHELRTPLALLRTEIDLALDRDRSKPELEDALRSAGEETDRLSQLAESLLLLARLDENVLSIQPELVFLDELLPAVAIRFERRAADAGRSIEVDGGGVQIAADPLRLEQALGNLVENALRHGAGSIRLSAVERGSAIELHVIDAGAGFGAGFLPRAFERFTRADPSRGRGGTGLGLAIVDAVAKAHGGTASAANAPAGGADVWLSLPRSQPNVKAQASLATPSGGRPGFAGAAAPNNARAAITRRSSRT